MSKTAALANVVELRPTTILTTKRVRPVVDKREYLTEDEVEKLIKAAPTPRDRAMILVGYTHGMRVSELINLPALEPDQFRHRADQRQAAQGIGRWRACAQRPRDPRAEGDEAGAADR